MARCVKFEEVVPRFSGKRVAIIGSAPSVLDNRPGYIDEQHDVIVRVNNYKLLDQRTGARIDVHYSFYGSSIRKTREELRRDGVSLCMCKCPNSQPIESEWHVRNKKVLGIDFRYIYENRKDFWFCDTFIPDDARFVKHFELLNRHIPTTGFAAILDVIDCNPALIYLTGFDFFSSGLHNVTEPWRAGNPEDPIGHQPELEARWLAENAQRCRIKFDQRIKSVMKMMRVVTS